MNSVVVALALLAPAAPSPGPPAPDVKETVRNGLKWLAEQQQKDGSWQGLNGVVPTTITATAGLALLMEGSTLQEGKYAPNLRKLVAWLEKNTSDKGMLASNNDNERFQFVPTHANALLFLACAYDSDDDAERRARLEKLLAKATRFLIDQQTERGGWGFIGPRDGNSFDDSQNTVTALQALLAVRKAGVPVPRAATDKALQYLARATNRDGGIIYTNFNGQVPMGNDGQPGISAGAAAGTLTFDGPRPDQLAGWVRNTKLINGPAQPQFIRNGGAYVLLQQYQASRVAFALGESGHRRMDPKVPDNDQFRWSTHRAAVFAALKEIQAKDGSWSDYAFGPSYSSALALIILQLDNEYLPLFSR
jgi:hypothetical protein